MVRSPSRSQGISFLAVCIVGGLLLTGCSSTEERQQKALSTFEIVKARLTSFSDTVMKYTGDAFEFSWGKAKEVSTTIEKAEERINKVSEGVEKMQEGKKLIEDGLSGE